MRCIEMHYEHDNQKKCAEINRNMRCIEMNKHNDYFLLGNR